MVLYGNPQLHVLLATCYYLLMISLLLLFPLNESWRHLKIKL